MSRIIQGKCRYKLLRYRPFGVRKEGLDFCGQIITSEAEAERLKAIAKEELRLEKDPESMSDKELDDLITKIEKNMKKAAMELNFETAAELRDKMTELKKIRHDRE